MKDHQILLWTLWKAVTELDLASKTFVEIGTHYAGTTYAMGEALLQLGCKSSKDRVDGVQYVTIDIHFWNTNPAGKNGFYPIEKFREAFKKLEGRYGRPPPLRMIEGIGAEVVDVVPDPIVWVFCDGCHCRECVEAELAAYAPRIVPGGFFLFHDYGEEYRGYPPDQPYHGDPLRPFEIVEVLEEWQPEHPEFEHVTDTPVRRIGGGKFHGGTRVLRRLP